MFELSNLQMNEMGIFPKMIQAVKVETVESIEFS